MGKSVFFFSHGKQIKWFTVIAQGFKDYFPGVKIVLFVHGKSEVEFGQQFKQYDEVVDLIGGFTFNANLGLSEVPFSKNILDLENALDLSFFWEDAKVDRWIRAKKNQSFTVQYLNHAFEVLYKKYIAYDPICGYGESTMAIYRFGHRLFDRDKRPYLAAIATRYYDRFYFEDDWYWKWEDSMKYYHKFLKEGIPADVLEKVYPIYERIAVNRRKPLAFENFAKTNSKGFKDFNFLKLGKVASIFKNLRSIPPEETQNNIRYSIIETSVKQKLQRYFGNKKNYRDYLKLVEGSVPENCQFSTFFLHYQPEYTVDSLGKFYIDQNHLISNIASALPAGHFLVVKDHPTMVGLRPKEFYEHIKQNANVILVHHSLDSFKLIEKSKIIFSIVGTSTLEAMFIGVPSIMFGKYAFDTTNTISLCTNLWDLSDLIRRKLEEVHRPEEVKRHALALLAGKYVAAFSGDIILPEIDPNDLERNKDNFERIRKSTVDYLTIKFPQG